MAVEQPGFIPEDYKSQSSQDLDKYSNLSGQESSQDIHLPHLEGNLLISSEKDFAGVKTEQTIFERNSSREDNKSKGRKSVFASALGLIGGESAARRRSDRRLQKEIDALQARVKQGEIAARHLESLAPDTAEGLRSVATKQEEFIAAIENTTADTVLENVIEAAEHDVPLELEYERRQEIKDEMGSPSTKAGATPVSEVIAEMATSMDVAQNTIPALVNDIKENISPSSFTYKQAIKRGFQSAVIMIAVAFLVLVIKAN